MQNQFDLWCKNTFTPLINNVLYQWKFEMNNIQNEVYVSMDNLHNNISETVDKCSNIGVNIRTKL